MNIEYEDTNSYSVEKLGTLTLLNMKHCETQPLTYPTPTPTLPKQIYLHPNH